MTYLYDPSYEDIVGTPEEIIEDARDLRAFYPPNLPATRRLRAHCLYGWHSVLLGSFKYDDDYIELPNGRGMSYETWRKRKWRAELPCDVCGRATQHVAKGWAWV